MDMKTRVGIRIKTLRKNRSLSQADLAGEIDRSVDAISAIERGKSLPNVETLERLANALKVSVRDFFEVSEADSSPRRSALMVDIQDHLNQMPISELELTADLIKRLAKEKR